MKYLKAFKFVVYILGANMVISGCNTDKRNNIMYLQMKETQITFSAKTHALDNNDNFSPDGKFLCYDTRATVFNTDIGNSKTIEMVEIGTGQETVLWDPPHITGEKAAPGVGAVSWHPTENKVVFIHGPTIEEVDSRGYYGKPNRTALEVSADGKKTAVKVDKRDIETHRPTTPGAHRGGTHRHEYSRDGNRIGFTYDDYLLRQYDRTIGYLVRNPKAPPGYSHYFALLVKPAVKGESKPGEIEKAYDDSWVDTEGTKRAFIAKIRSEDGIGYDSSLCVVEIPGDADITRATAGSENEYPEPPRGIRIHRITHSGWAGGIVRGSFDGRFIAYLVRDKMDVKQINIVASDGSDKDPDMTRRPRTVTELKEDATNIRWHPSGDWLFFLSGGNVIMVNVSSGKHFGKMIQLSSDDAKRDELVVSPDGNRLAYVIRRPTKNETGQLVKDVENKDFRQVFVMDLDWNAINSGLE